MSKFQLRAATRLLAADSWFDQMSREEQEQYIAEHPNSKYADQPLKTKQEHPTPKEQPKKEKRSMHDVDRRLEELSNKPNLTPEERREVEELEDELDKLTEVEDFDVEEHDTSDLDKKKADTQRKLKTVNKKMDDMHALYRKLSDQPSTPELDAQLDRLEKQLDDLMVEQTNLEDDLAVFGDD